MTTILVFTPCGIFGLAIDIQIIASTLKYKPVCFTDLPFKGARGIMLFLGFISLLMSAIGISFSCIVFGGLTSDPNLRRWLFICFLIKALTWSPFLGLEYYDMLFEWIYKDVYF